MSCISIEGLSLECGAEGNVGGIERVYMLAAKDLAPTTGTPGDPDYTFATTDVVNAIGVASGKNFVEIGLLKETAGLKETITVNDQTGSAFFNNEFSLTLAGITTENRDFVKSVLQQPVVVIVKTFKESTPQYLVTGLNRQLKLSAGEGGTGIARTDLSGYKLTFSGFSSKAIAIVDNTIMADLLSPA